MVNPRYCYIPEGNSDLGKRAIELMLEADVELDDWQALVLEGSLRVADDKKWAAKEVGLVVARQNGKNMIELARELAELYIVKSNLVIHSAHQFSTSREHFLKMKMLVEETPRLSREVKKIRASHAEVEIELTGNRRIEFRTRSKGGGRGFSADLLVFDEAMILTEMSVGALFPTKRARPNAQVWYAGSAVDQTIHEHGLVFSGVRRRGIEGSPKLAYFEWSVEGDNPSTVPASVLDDKAAWAQATPALEIRIPVETMVEEREQLKHLPRTFATELLSVGDWPNPDFVQSNPISLQQWMELEDTRSKAGDQTVFAFDVSPDRKGSISVASKRPDDLWHVEVVEDRPGTAWLPSRLAELQAKHHPEAVVCDSVGPAASLVPALLEAGVEVTQFSTQEMAQACSRLVDTIEEGNLRHYGQAELTGAIHAASTRPLGDAWAWSRKNSAANISPLVSVTLALSAAQTTFDREPLMAWG